jgi:hypothetical protein
MGWIAFACNEMLILWDVHIFSSRVLWACSCCGEVMVMYIAFDKRATFLLEGKYFLAISRREL